MSELFLIIKDFIQQNPDLVTWFIAGLICVLGLFLQTSWIKEYIGEWKLNRLLRNAGIKSLHNISVTDDMDEKIFIEHLILTANGILLLGVKRFRGLIFAAEKIDLWTQVVGKKSYKFENPLHQLEGDVIVLNSMIENTKITGKVLFISGSEFPKGKPKDVITVSDLKTLSQESANSEVSDALLTEWKLLTASAVSSNVEENTLIDSNKLSGINIYSLIMIILLVTLWLLWRLNF